MLNLATELGCLLRTMLITDLVLHVRIILAQYSQFHILLIYHSLQCFDQRFQFLLRLDLPVAYLNRFTLVRELLTCDFGRLLLDCGKLFFSLVLQVRRNRSRLLLVLL
jgi:hypothetical protein